MASDIPPCLLEYNLASGAGYSSDFVSNEFRNPKIGNIDGSTNGILVEDEQFSENNVFVRDGGDYCPMSDGDYEGAGDLGTADSVLWGNWEYFGNDGSVRQCGDSCSLSISDFEGPEADFYIEGSDLRDNWNYGEDFSGFVSGCGDYCPMSNGDSEGAGGPSTANSVLWGSWEDFGNNGYVRQSGDSCSLSNSDFEGPEADFDIEGSGLRGNWKDGEDFMVDYLGSKIRIDCTTALLAVADWMNTLQVECENFQETACYREMYQDLTKERLNEDIATFQEDQLTAGSNCGWHAIKTCPVQHKATWERVPCYTPINPNELIGYGDYETICYDAIEASRVEQRATTCDLVSSYDEDEPAKLHELLDKIDFVDSSYKEAYLTSLKAGALLADFQGSREAALPRELEESHDRWQESLAKYRDDTCNIRVQASLGDVSMKTSAYYDSCQIAQGESGTVLGSMEGSSGAELQKEPHEGLSYTLWYLGLQDLLSIEKVCKSLHAAVKDDPLMWQTIHVEYPLSEKLTDDALLKLVERSQGQLEKLSLVECLKITDDGLKQVLDISPKLTKLCLPGCTRLTADGIVKNVKAHKECSMGGLKQLRIGNLFGITREHLEKLNYLLDGGLQQKSHSAKPRYYPNGRYYSLSYDDDSTIDIEACPICGNARLVYDCTNESCQKQKDQTVRECRACTFCIARCDECGRCIDGSEYEETFCLDMLCADCVRASQLPRIRRACLW